MDPDKCLEELRNDCYYLEYATGVATWVDQADYMKVVEKVRALDEWLSSGGFLPKDWSKGRG